MVNRTIGNPPSGSFENSTLMLHSAREPTGLGAMNSVMGLMGSESTVAVASIALRQQVVRRAGTFRNFYVTLNAAVAGGSKTLALNVNGVDSAITVTLNVGDTVASDTVNEVAVVAGDLVCIHITAPAGTAPSTLIAFGLEFVAGTTNFTTMMYSSNENTHTTSHSTPLIGDSYSFVIALDYLERQLIPVAGTIQNLRAQVSVAPGVGASWVATLRVNGVDTAMTCTIAGANTFAVDEANSIAVVAGDLVSIGWVASAAPAPAATNLKNTTEWHA